MEKSSTQNSGSDLTKEAIIGLGEASFRKNHFPTLQKKIGDLELLNCKYRTLIETIPDILLVCNNGDLSLFSSHSELESRLIHAMLENNDITILLKDSVEKSRNKRSLVTVQFSFVFDSDTSYFEARSNITEANDVLIIIRDITTEVISKNKLQDMVYRDGLTQLYNRQFFEQYLDEIDGRYCKDQTMIILDIDGLKIINDTMGHPEGDKLLVTVADILKNVFDQAKCVARIGGDEFGVLLDDRQQDEVELLLEKLNSEVNTYNLVQTPLNLSVSFGYSCHKDGIADLNIMFREADNKMSQNKLLKEKSNRSSIVKAMTKMLEAKDYITQGHAHRMEKLAVMMGKALGLSHDQLDRMELLAKFHDLGKVGIPDSILMKPQKLNDNEWEIMKSHSLIGKKIAETSPELRDISNLILLHHERWDATGYPLGIRGEDIPVECRILSIVDTFDAMTNDRPYRAALPLQDAVDEIIRCADTQFDAYLVGIFVNLVHPNS